MARPQLDRLTPYDLSNLRLETPASPFHFGGLAIVEGTPLLDRSGALRLDEIRRRIEARLARVPRLRRRIHDPGLLRGGPLWVDDPDFDIRRHVLTRRIPEPGREPELLEAAAHLYCGLLDRRRPLWELWFMTGLGPDRVGVLLKLHHSVADGMAAVAIMGFLFDPEPGAPDPAPVAWSPEPVPSQGRLLADSLSTKAAAVGHAIGRVSHPVRLARSASRLVREGRAVATGRTAAPRTSINRVPQPGRRVRLVRMDVEAVKDTARASKTKVNDVMLDLVAGGLRHLMISRGEQVDTLQLYCSVAVSLRSGDEARHLGNDVGVLAVPLPVWESEPERRLRLIGAATRKAKAEQHPAGVQSAVGRLAATPIAQHLMAHQRVINVFTTNLAGPPVPVYLLGARILDVVPIVQIAGNVALAFCAFSYDGRLNLVVTADATGFPDVDVLAAGMEQTWRDLRARTAGTGGNALVAAAAGIAPGPL